MDNYGDGWISWKKLDDCSEIAFFSSRSMYFCIRYIESVLLEVGIVFKHTCFV